MTRFPNLYMSKYDSSKLLQILYSCQIMTKCVKVNKQDIFYRYDVYFFRYVASLSRDSFQPCSAKSLFT